MVHLLLGSLFLCVITGDGLETQRNSNALTQFPVLNPSALEHSRSKRGVCDCICKSDDGHNQRAADFSETESKANPLAPIVSAVIAEAALWGAPFTAGALARLARFAFGNETALRTTDVVIHNKSKFSYVLSDSKCKSGGFRVQELPEHEISTNSSVIYATESSGGNGAKCSVTYTSRDQDAQIVLATANPLVGKNNGTVQVLKGKLRGFITFSAGNNNHVRFVLENI